MSFAWAMIRATSEVTSTTGEMPYPATSVATITALENAGARFRNEVETGPGGKQIQVDDPDGNPIELHEAPKG